MIKRNLLPILALYLFGASLAHADSTMTGKEVFESYCVYCHAPGYEHPGTRQLAKRRGDDKAVLAQRDDLTEEYINFIVRHGLMSMPPFAPSDLTDAKLKALVNYLVK